jgi:hypothetical protein
MLATSAGEDGTDREGTGLAYHQDHGIPEGDQAGPHGDAQAPFGVDTTR